MASGFVTDPGNRRAVVGTASWLIAARALIAASAAGAGLIAAAELGPSGRGEVAVGLLVGYFGAVLGLLGLENTLPRTASGRPFASAYGLGREFTRPSGVIGAVVALAGCAIGQWSGWFAWHTPIAVVTIAAGTAAVRLAASAGAASGDSRRQVTISLGSGLTLLVGAFGLLVMGDSTPSSWLWLYGGSTMVGVVAARLPRSLDPDWPRQQLELRLGAVPALAATVTNFLTLRADRLLLPVLTSTRELGVYVVASTIVDVVAVPAKAISQVLAARWRLTAPPPFLASVAFALLAGSIPAMALAVTGRFAIPAILGPDYGDSGDLLLILGPAVSLYIAARVVQARHLSLGHQRVVGLSETVGFILALAAYIVLIPSYGATGAAVGSLVGYGATFAVTVGAVLVEDDERALR